MNVILDHRARFDVAGLAEAGVCRTFGPRLHLVVLIALGTALAMPAQEVSVTPQQGSSATATTTTSEATRTTRGASDSNRSQTPTTPAVNPLEGYLAEWMRPRDHALLRKDAAAPSATESWRRLATTSTSTSPATRKPAPKSAAPTANPYIDAMNAAANPAPVSSLDTAPSVQVSTGKPHAAPPSAPASLVEPEAPPPPPATRYQPPPSSDAKYFPQLKRF